MLSTAASALSGASHLSMVTLVGEVHALSSAV